jgi:hypothetical protein
MNMIEHALEYARRGWLVFPLHTPTDGVCSCHKADCGSVGKHPRTMNGVKDATTDDETIRRWWSMWPAANIGLATGAESGLVVVDIDPRHGGTESITELQNSYGKFTDRVYAATGGGGWHLLFSHPGVRIGNIQSTPDRPGKLGQGVDVRGDGGYIVAAPSLHASGKVYEWKVSPTVGLPDMPAWLVHILTEQRQASPAFAVEGQITEGQRDNTLASFAGTMRRRGMSEASIFAALQIENERCNPPLPAQDITRISKSISRYDPADPALVQPEIRDEGERPDGIYFVSEIADRIDALYEKGLTAGATTGWPALDRHYTVKRGQWTVVTGIPGHGKSAVLDAMLVNLAMYQGWRFAVCSPENQPLERHAAGLMSIWAGEAFGEGAVDRMTPATRDKARKWLDEHFVFVLPDEQGCTVTGILERVDWLSCQQNIHGVVIDPWNELEHRRPNNMTETEYISQSLTRMRRFARDYDLHLWLIAHPTKLSKDIKTGHYPVPTLYDISGSAHFRNKADMGLAVWRDMKNEKSATEVHIQKARFRECGKPGKVDLYFDVVSGRFQETIPDYSDRLETEDAWRGGND